MQFDIFWTLSPPYRRNPREKKMLFVFICENGM